MLPPVRENFRELRDCSGKNCSFTFLTISSWAPRGAMTSNSHRWSSLFHSSDLKRICPLDKWAYASLSKKTQKTKAIGTPSFRNSQNHSNCIFSRSSIQNMLKPVFFDPNRNQFYSEHCVRTTQHPRSPIRRPISSSFTHLFKGPT